MTPIAPSREKVSFGRLLWAGPLTIAVAAVINLVLRAVARAVLNPGPAFSPLQGPLATFLTVAGTLGAVIAFAIVGALSRRPRRVFLIVSIVALGLSFLPALALLFAPAMPAGGAGPGSMPLGDVTLSNVLALMVMHTAAWATCITLLPRLALRPAAR